jgi:hypothetical protein
MKYYTSWGKSLEHVILNEKKGRQPRRRPPSILTEGKNVRQMLYNVDEEPVVVVVVVGRHTLT